MEEDKAGPKKRNRLTPSQLEVLNNVFANTCFPSAEVREILGKQLNMTSRAVQVWFQNKRQAHRAKASTKTPDLVYPGKIKATMKSVYLQNQLMYGQSVYPEQQYYHYPYEFVNAPVLLPQYVAAFPEMDQKPCNPLSIASLIHDEDESHR
jgi:hypothetical protein